MGKLARFWSLALYVRAIFSVRDSWAVSLETFKFCHFAQYCGLVYSAVSISKTVSVVG